LARLKTFAYTGQNTHTHTHTHTHTQKTPFIHQSVPCMVFEPTFPVFEWWKAAYALYPAATVMAH
jgi:hypothetical protein